MSAEAEDVLSRDVERLTEELAREKGKVFFWRLVFAVVVGHAFVTRVLPVLFGEVVLFG